MARTRLTRHEAAIVEAFLGKPSLAANPGMIETLSRKGISRVGAKKACERLVLLGVLQRKMKRPRNKKMETAHYTLISDNFGFARVTSLYLESLESRHGEGWVHLALGSYLPSPYARQCLTKDFIRWVLHAKNVELRRSFRLAQANGDSEAPERFGERVHFRLPARGPQQTADAMVTQALARSTSVSPTISSALNEHYERDEDRILVAPLFALLQVSPTALRRFLSDWQPFQPESFTSNGQGLESVEHLLFRLIYDAIHDLSLCRFLPQGLDVYVGEVCPQAYARGREERGLLELHLESRQIVCFDAGFDTFEDVYCESDDSAIENALVDLAAGKRSSLDDVFQNLGSNLVQVTRNPENCWVRVWWRDSEPLPSSIGAEAS